MRAPLASNSYDAWYAVLKHVHESNTVHLHRRLVLPHWCYGSIITIDIWLGSSDLFLYKWIQVHIGYEQKLFTTLSTFLHKFPKPPPIISFIPKMSLTCVKVDFTTDMNWTALVFLYPSEVLDSKEVRLHTT